MRFTVEDIDYWLEVLEGEREPDPRSGMDMEELCLMLLQEIKRMRKEQDAQPRIALNEGTGE